MERGEAVLGEEGKSRWSSEVSRTLLADSGRRFGGALSRCSDEETVNRRGQTPRKRKVLNDTQKEKKAKTQCYWQGYKQTGVAHHGAI